MLEAAGDIIRGGKWYFWDELPWMNGIQWNDEWKVVENKHREWMSCFKLSPPDMQSRSDPERLRHAFRFHGALRVLGGGHVLWLDEFHEPEKPYPMVRPGNSAAARIEEARAKVYDSVVAHYRSRHYLTVQWRKPAALSEKLARWVLLAHPGDKTKESGPYLQAFIDRVHSFERHIGFMGAKMLSGDDLATYLHDTISRHRHKIKFGDWEDWIAPQLVDMPINGNGALTIGAGPETEYMVAVTVHSYPRGCDAGLLDGTEEFPAIASLPITYRRVTRIAVQSKTESVKDIDRLRTKTELTRESPLRSLAREIYKDAPTRTNHEVEHVAEEVEEWLSDLARGKTLRCQCTTTFIVYHKDPTQAIDGARTIATMLREQSGLSAQVEWINGLEAFLGTVPGNAHHNYVRPYVNTLAAAALAPLATAWGGIRYDDQLDGPPLLIGTTGGANRMHVTLSPSAEGMASHGIATGPSGSGKSSLFNYMCMSFLKYPGARVFRIDKGRSAYVSTFCAGGLMIDPVATGQGFQPLRHIAEEMERKWATSWLLALVRLRKPDLAEDSAVDDAIKATLEWMGAEFNPDDITMSAFVNALPIPALADALKPYTRDGTLGYLFDTVDSRSYDADYITIELDRLLKQVEVAGPLTSYLLHLMRRLSSPDRPMFAPIDEAAMAMVGPFKEMLDELMREARRENIRVMFGTQSAVDIATSELAPIILNACSLKIFFPDIGASNENVAAAHVACGVNEQWIERLTYKFKEDEPRFCLIVQDEGARFMNLDMERDVDPVTYWTCCMTNSRSVADARRIKQMHGDFMDNWLNEKQHGIRLASHSILEAAE